MPQELYRDFSYIGWIFQTFFAYWLPLIGLVILESLMGATNSAGWDLVPYVVVPLLALAMALGISAVFPSSVIEGISVWMLPAGVWLLTFVCTLIGEPSRLSLFFWDQGQGEAGWLIGLLTIPTWGCCWYAAAMGWRRRTQRDAPGGGNDP